MANPSYPTTSARVFVPASLLFYLYLGIKLQKRTAIAAAIIPFSVNARKSMINGFNGRVSKSSLRQPTEKNGNFPQHDQDLYF